MTLTLSQYLNQQRRAYLRDCLVRAHYKVAHAARIAGVCRQTFYKYCERDGISIPRKRPLPSRATVPQWLSPAP